MDKGTLYIVATPIGNLGDISARAAETLAAADVVAAEDTRHTVKLLNHLGIKNRLISYHEYSGGQREELILSFLREGKSVALVTDAGTPIISDPGDSLVARAAAEGMTVTAIPGACAAITALVLSGLSAERFVFEGFLPRDNTRAAAIARIKGYTCTSVIYESPKRLAATLAELAAEAGDRRVSICKELTKLYESIDRTTLCAAAEKYADADIKGEYVLVIEGGSDAKREVTDEDILTMLEEYIGDGVSKKTAVAQIATELEVPKNRVYRIMLDNI